MRTPQTACLLHCTQSPLVTTSSQVHSVPACYPSAHGRHHVRVVVVPKGRVYRGGCGEHVSSVTERWQVAHGHVSGQRGGTEGRALVVQAFGELLVAVAAPLALFGFVGHLSVTCLYPLLFHGERSVHLCREAKSQQGKFELKYILKYGIYFIEFGWMRKAILSIFVGMKRTN